MEQELIDISGIWPQWHAVDVLGKGSYGSVYRIEKNDYGIVTSSALKVVSIPHDEEETRELESSGMDEESIRTFYKSRLNSIANEIRTMESLKSAPNVVSIEDYYIEEMKDRIGWRIYIRMELLQSLTDYIKKRGMLTVEEVVRIGADICTALSYCEKQNIIHRDIKPSNVFLDKFGSYKLGDFGIAKQLSQGANSLHSTRGTSKYMAPEVMRGDKYNGRVDIYSLGILMYRYLNHNRYPFEPPSTVSLLQSDIDDALKKRMSGEPVPMPDGCPADLGAIVVKACQADPGKRYGHAGEMLGDLRRYIRDNGGGLTELRLGLTPDNGGYGNQDSDDSSQGGSYGSDGHSQNDYGTGSQGGSYGSDSHSQSGYGTGSQGGSYGSDSHSQSGYGTGGQSDYGTGSQGGSYGSDSHSQSGYGTGSQSGYYGAGSNSQSGYYAAGGSTQSGYYGAGGSAQSGGYYGNGGSAQSGGYYGNGGNAQDGGYYGNGGNAQSGGYYGNGGNGQGGGYYGNGGNGQENYDFGVNNFNNYDNVPRSDGSGLGNDGSGSGSNTGGAGSDGNGNGGSWSGSGYGDAGSQPQGSGENGSQDERRKVPAALIILIVVLLVGGVFFACLAFMGTGQTKSVKYTVHYDAAGGDGTMEEQTISSGSRLNRNTYTYEGMHFAGWTYSKDAEEADLPDGKKVTLADLENHASDGTVTMYAFWNKDKSSKGNSKLGKLVSVQKYPLLAPESADGKRNPACVYLTVQNDNKEEVSATVRVMYYGADGKPKDTEEVEIAYLAAGEQKLAFSDCGSAEYNITSIDCETYVWPERTDAGYTSADDLKLTIEETDRTADHVTFSVTNHDSRTAYHVEAGAFGIDENRKFFGGDHKLLDKIRPDETVTFEFDSPVGILKSDTFITGFFDGLHFK